MPNYIDLQVNGYGGVDFNQDDLSADQLHHACRMLRDAGVERALGTIITEQIDTMCRRIRRLVELRAADALAREVLAGVHIEGPFISATDGYRGAHPRDAVRPADADAMRQLLDSGNGLVRIVTLAPEQDAGAKVTQWLTGQGVVVSAGHTDASLEQLRAAIDAGLSMFTHLGNGCPMQVHRHDNIVQRALSLSDRLYVCFIADGVHVPTFALRNYIRCVGVDRAIVVTDAMAAAGLGPGTYTLGRWTVEVDEHLAGWAPGRAHLLGSAGTMARSEQLLREQVGLSQADCERLLNENPATLLTPHPA